MYHLALVFAHMRDLRKQTKRSFLFFDATFYALKYAPNYD